MKLYVKPRLLLEVDLISNINNHIQFDKTDGITWFAAFNGTYKIAFDQQDLHSSPEFEREMDCRC